MVGKRKTSVLNTRYYSAVILYFYQSILEADWSILNTGSWLVNTGSWLVNTGSWLVDHCHMPEETHFISSLISRSLQPPWYSFTYTVHTVKCSVTVIPFYRHKLQRGSANYMRLCGLETSKCAYFRNIIQLFGRIQTGRRGIHQNMLRWNLLQWNWAVFSFAN